MLLLKVGLVIPAHNEAENLKVLVPEIFTTLKGLYDVHVLVIDDGSTDETTRILSDLSAQYPDLGEFRVPDRSGKANALAKGFTEIQSQIPDVICIMDGDYQDNPAFLPLMVQKALAGFDLVTGKRVNRAEKLTKRVSSKIYNRLVGLTMGTPGRDHNSGMKVLSLGLASYLAPLLVGDMHRFISALAHWQGFRTTEIAVLNRPRHSGVSKYGVGRLLTGSFDLFSLRLAIWAISKRWASFSFLVALLIGTIFGEFIATTALLSALALGAGIYFPLFGLGGLILFQAITVLLALNARIQSQRISFPRNRHTFWPRRR